MDAGPCGCLDALASRDAFEATFLGTDALYGESWVDLCRACGRQWLRYELAYEGVSGSGRWFRGVVRPGQAVDARNASLVFADLPGYFAGGSFFGGRAHRRSGPAETREAPSMGPAFVAEPSTGPAAAPVPLPSRWRSFVAEHDDGDPQFEPHVAASPDGARSAFSTRRVEQDRTSVWLDGVLVTEIPGSAVHAVPAWAPDGRTLGLWIVHLEDERSAFVVLPGLEGEGELRYRNDLVDSPAAPAWSPSGRSVALLRTRTPRHEFTKTGDPEVILLDAAGGEYYPVSGAGEASGPLRWTDARTLDAGGRRIRFHVPV